MLSLSPLCREGIIHDLDIVPFMYYDIPTNDSEQLDLPLSPYNKFYIKFSPLHPNDAPELIVRNEREKIENFLFQECTPSKRSVV